MDFDVDLVYLWCDGSDPNFKKKKQLWLNKEGKKSSKQATSSARFEQVDELKYSLRSVEKYMPWIHHIYVITSDQSPKWLNINHPKITLVNDGEIIPKKYLPVFNSNAIEVGLGNIPNLSEHFLYACDDMFINRPLDKNFFFKDKSTVIVRVKENLLDPLTLYAEQLSYAEFLMKRDFGSDIPFFSENMIEPHHNIDAYLKTDYQACVNHFSKEYTETFTHRFRKATSIQRWIVSIWSFLHHHAQVKIVPVCNKETDKDPIVIDSLYINNRRDRAFKRLFLYTPALFCINDSEFSSASDRAKTKQFLEDLFPKSSEFEK